MRIPDKVVLKQCENPKCNKEHDGSYGKGRFCSRECKIEYIASKNRGANNPKVKAHLDKLRAEGKVHAQAPYGTWKCVKCGQIFETRSKLKEHLTTVHGVVRSGCIVTDGKYICRYCGKEFDTGRQAGGHMVNCPNHPNKAEHDEMHKRQGRKFSEKYARGEIHISVVSHKHTLETRQKISAKRAEQVMNQYLNKEHVKVKWYKVKNIEGKEFSVRGHWEENVALRLNELGILWVKAAPIKYFKDYWHNYIPDLYIPDRDIYIEVKGGYPDTDREKMRLVVEQHPEKKIYFIHKQYHDFIEGKCEFDDGLCISEEDL